MILFGSISLCILADYLDIDYRQIRREREISGVIPFPQPQERKRAA
jgi:hypothetical protein